MGGPEEFWKKKFLCADIDYIHIHFIFPRGSMLQSTVMKSMKSPHMSFIYFGERKFRIILKTKKNKKSKSWTRM